MTSSWSLFKALSWPRFKQMSLLIGIEALAVIVTSLWTAIKETSQLPHYSIIYVLGWRYL